MSSVPRPYILPSFRTGSNGGESHASRSTAGTTSMWETIHTVPGFLPAFLARMLGLRTEGSVTSGTSILLTSSNPWSLSMR